MSWDRRNQNYHDEHDRGRFDHGNYDDRYRDPGNFRGRDLRADRGNGERFDDIRDFQQNDFDEGSDRNFGRGRYESHGYMDNPDDNYLHPLPPDGHARYGREIISNADNRRNGKDGNRRMEVDNHFSNDSQQDHRYSGERMEMRNMNSEDYFDRGRHENPAPHRFYDEDMHTKADVHHQQNDFGARDEYYEDLDEVDLRVRPNYGADQLRAKSEPREYEQYDFDERKRDNAWEKRSDNKRRPYQSQPDLIGGHQNMGFEGDLDENDRNYRPKVHRGVSLRRRSRKSRRERRSDFQNEQRMSFADGMKTIIQRRKTLHMHRPLSELMSSSRTNRPGSVFHGPGDDDIDDEDDRLPSNRNKKRMTLKERMEIREKKGPLTTEDMAKLLRDKVLSQEASHGLDLQNFKMKWHSFTSWTKNWVYQLELWAGAFKVIEGHFGQSTVSYFRFLRWLMFLNLFMTLIMFGVVLLPFLSLDVGGSFVSSVNACSSIPNNMAVFYTLNYTADVKSKVNQSSTAEKVQDVLQGTGWMENTVLFYGAYHNKTAYLITGDAFTYNMSLAYLCAVGLTFMLSFILLVKNSAKGLKQSAVSSVGGNITMYCNKVFGAWDYCISESKTAQLKHSNLLQDFKNDLEYQRLQWKKASRTAKEKFKLYSIRVLINILVIAMLGGALYLIYYTNEQLVTNSQTLNETEALMMQYLPSITIMLLNVIVPFIFNKLVIAEDYMPAFAIRITLIRTVLLRLSSLGILMISLYTSLQPKKRDQEVLLPCDNLKIDLKNKTGITTTPFTTTTTGNTTTTTKSSSQLADNMCWETYVGQQIYKLVMLNFIVVVLSTVCGEFPRKFVYDKLHDKLKVVNLVGQQVFDLSKNILDLVYLQTLCWLGLFFSPIIPAMCFVKCFIFFYLKKGSLLTNCLPMQQYGTSKSNSLFMMVLLLSFFLASAPIIYMIGSLPPSQSCGPFRVHGNNSFVMFDTITYLVGSFDKAKDVFFFMGTGGFMAILALCLCLLMYYFWMVGQANYKLSKSLREQLKIEGQDKQFLVARVNEALDRDY